MIDHNLCLFCWRLAVGGWRSAFLLSARGEPGCANEVGRGDNKTLYSFFSYTKDPNGPWSKIESLKGVQTKDGSKVDQNLV